MGQPPALRSAVNNRDLETVEALIAAGVDVNATLLAQTIEYDYLEIAEALIKAGVDVNASIWYGWTSLMIAAKNNNSHAVRMLIEADADVSATNWDGWTPLMWSVWSAGQEYLATIHNIHLGTAESIRYSDHPIDHMLRRPNETTEEVHLEVVEALIAAGADVMVTNNYGWTPLMLAAKNKHLEVAKALIAAGAGVVVVK